MHRMRCSEIWGGIRNQDHDVGSAGIHASLFSGACDGGKGGDIYYLSVCGSDRLTRLAIADVMGHGAGVSRVSEWVYEALKTHMNDTSGDEVLAEVNRLACEQGHQSLTTAAVIAYYTADRRAYFAYAGHHATLVRRSAAGEWIAVNIDIPETGLVNLPLGVDPAVRFSQKSLPLTSGDRLFLYTDGIIEAPDDAGNLFGDERLLDTLQQCGDAPLPAIKDTVLQAVRAHAGGPLDHDDVTLLVVEVN